MASLIIGMSTRLETKPGASCTSTGVLPIRREAASTASQVSWLVARPRMTSTSCITGTGFMKCMPITFSGRAGGGGELGDRDRAGVGGEDGGRRGRCGRARRARCCLTSSLSTTASTTRSARGEGARARRRSRGGRGPGRGPRRRACLWRPAARAPCRSGRGRAPGPAGTASTSITSYPLWAATWAIPCPMVPAPTTPIVWISAYPKTPPVTRCKGQAESGSVWDRGKGVKEAPPGRMECLLDGPCPPGRRRAPARHQPPPASAAHSSRNSSRSRRARSASGCPCCW